MNQRTAPRRRAGTAAAFTTFCLLLAGPLAACQSRPTTTFSAARSAIGIAPARPVLVGLTVEEATRIVEAKCGPHHVTVQPLQIRDPACRNGAVCAIDPERWDGCGHGTRLFTNRDLAITTPDSE